LPFLIIQEKTQPDRAHHIEGDEVTIGRGKKADIVFPNVSVSRFHTKIYGAAGGWFITDLGSQNGTIVNDKKVEKSQLNSGDTIVLGKYTLIFVGDESLGLWKGKDLAEYPIYGGHASGAQDATYALSPAMIQKLRETERKKNFANIDFGEAGDPLFIGEKPLTFGGSDGTPFKGFFSFTSGATVTWDGRDHLIHKQGMTSVSVNGNPVKTQRLRDGDTITIGKTKVTYKISDS